MTLRCEDAPRFSLIGTSECTRNAIFCASRRGGR